MAVKAKDQITVVDMTDIQAVTIYYKLQASTLAVPSKPTVLNPTDWATTEPTYTSGSTNTLYTCVRTLWGNGTTFSWSDVSVSSSYEAAKAAYNKAASAQDTAQSVKNYFFSDTTGAHITRTAGAPDTGRNVLIDTNHFCFRDAKTILMEIAANMISLGADSTNATIRLCKDTLRIYGRTTGSITDINLSADVGSDSAPHYAGVFLGLADFSTDTNLDSYIGINHEVNGSVRSTTAHFQADYVDVAGLKVPISKVRHVLSETELYNNESTAVNVGVTLSETAANFTDMEIFYKSSDGYYGSVKVHNPNGKNVSLLSATPQSATNEVYFKQRTVHISGAVINTLVVGSGYGIGEERLANGSTVSFSGADVIAITRVVGWRY